jgi:hypothetical protein
MESSEFLSEQKFQQILKTAIIRAQIIEKVSVLQFVEEIKLQIISDKYKVDNLDYRKGMSRI